MPSPILRVCAAAGALILASVAGPAPAEEAQAVFNADQEAAIESMIRRYLLDHPEILEEAFQALQVKKQQQREGEVAAAIERNLDALTGQTGAPVVGNPEGDVTVVEFFDYNCGYCKPMAALLMDILDTDGNVRMVMKEFPILSQESVNAAHAALAVHRQGTDLYIAFHNALMAHRGRVDDAAVRQAANQVGVDIARMEADMGDPEITETIEQNRALARELQIGGTPAFVIGDTVYPGALSRDALEDAIAEAREG